MIVWDLTYDKPALKKLVLRVKFLLPVLTETCALFPSRSVVVRLYGRTKEFSSVDTCKCSLDMSDNLQ